MPRNRLWVATLAGAALLAGCDGDPTGENPGRAERPAGPSSSLTSDVLATRRIGLELRASGAFRPGAPIVITSTAFARHRASAVDYELVVLDEPGSADTDGRGRGRSAGTFRGRMERGNQRQLTATVTFPAAGYYRVLVAANTEPAEDDPTLAGDSVLIDLSSEIVHILVDERDGRVTAGYDPTAHAGRNPLYGSFGPFVAGRAPGAAAAGARLQRSAQRAVGGRHVLQYNDPAAPTTFLAVPNADVVAECLDNSFNPVSVHPAIRTAADGSFTISCASGYYNATAYLRNQHANVMNTDRSNAGVVRFYEYSDTNQRVNNNHAAHVHTLLNRYVPIARQRFGMFREQVPILVNQSSAVAFSTNYDQINDVIRQNHDVVFGEYGRFVTVHEYGHAYHWKAVEPPVTYFCNEANTHQIDGQYNFNCAFVEGFADFFAFWVAGDLLVRHGASDYAGEVQKWYTGKDGAQVEGAVAGFLYDLVDGPSDPDSYTNTTGFDDASTVDGVQYPGSFIVNTMKHCTLGGSTQYDDLYGSDELVYCLEGGLGARAVAATFGSNWAEYYSVHRNVADPVGFNQAHVRRLWKFNMYGTP